ncbi:xylulokinase [soil metagenome]
MAGVDCSTQSTKVVLVDADDGSVLAVARAPHEVRSGGGGRRGVVSETDPAEWSRALARALADTGRAGEVAAIAVAAQQHGLVVVGADGEPLRPAVLWNDTRSMAEAAALVDDFCAEWWAESMGSVPVPSFTVTSWAWLRSVDADTADAVVAVRLPHDWLTESLCGRGVTDRGDASGTGWWSTPDGRYRHEVLDHPAVGLDVARLPEVLGPSELAGEVTPAAAAKYGLRAGTLVGPGTGDNMGAALGLGLAPGEAVVSLGTSGTVYTVAIEPAADPSGVVAGFADATGLYLPLACTLNATLAVERVAGWLGLWREEVAPSSGGVVVVPFLEGERTPNLPFARGTITGLTLSTSSGEVLRSAYEGVVVSLLDALERVAGQEEDTAPLVLVGGGARGGAWREVVSRLSGRPVVVPDAEELVALGAAAQAAALLTGEAPDAVARRWGTRAGLELDAVEADAEAVEHHA